jgi:glycosyltransferase involved in cell wall biosynthesis
MALNTKPKILIFSDWYAPAFKGGGPIRSIVNLVEALKKEYDFYVFTADTDFGESSPMPHIKVDQWLVQDGVHVYYHAKGAMTYKMVKSVIKEINPHRIYLNSMFSNMIKPILAAYQSEKIIIACRGMLSTSALAVKPLRKFLYLWFLRTFGFAKYLNFHATSEQEVKNIKRIFPNAKSINVAGNIPVRIEATLPQAIKASNAIQLVFTGRMHPIKNLHILLQALQNVKGQITLNIIATREDEAYLNKCQQLGNELGKDIQVNWLLDLPHHQIKPYLQAAHFFFLLSEVESFGHAIFEALAVGCPVLISDQTPWKNLQEKKAGWDLSTSDPALITATLQELVDMNDPEWQSYRNGSLNLAESYVKRLNVDKEYCILFENRFNFNPLNDHDNQPPTLR